MLRICKASAGSGKTHNLTNTYVDLLFKDGNFDKEAFKKILAVTFTNKATDEMKQRVLERLYDNSKDSKHDDKTKMNWRLILLSILNDYSSFNISTIDRFFQKVLRAFAREVGQYNTYQVELDDSAVLAESIDMMLDGLNDGDKSDLLNWLIRLSIDAIEEGESWNTKPKLNELGKSLFSEEYRMKQRESAIDGQEYSREAVDIYMKRMAKLIKDFREKSIEIAQRWSAKMREYGLDYTDFKGGERSTFKKMGLYLAGEVFPIPDGLAKTQGEISLWSTKTSDRKSSIESAFADGLDSILGEFIVHYQDNYKYFATASMIRKNLYTLGILNDINLNIKDYCKKKNIVLLPDSTEFLNKIIDDGETPFIYERIGAWIENYMLDEFQDTSRMQWENFRPLLSESLDSGKDCLVVGDVKQSIYRFRSSDWKLLNTEVASGFKNYQLDETTLQDNWRSARNVVEFNNEFFQKAAKVLGDKYAGDVDGAEAMASLITDIYQDVHQELPSARDIRDGHVQLNFVEADSVDDFRENVLENLPQRIDKLVESGYLYSDIALLVRSNSEGSIIANTLVDRGYRVISEDSLFISSSVSVRKIVGTLQEYNDSNSGVEDAAAMVEERSIYNICEEIIRGLSVEERAEVAFIQAFLDTVVEYVSRDGSDLYGFLKWWNTSGVKRSISAPDGDNAVRVMTIHKSKGLGFRAVIIPFLKDSFVPPRGKTLWCAPDNPIFEGLGVLPIKYTKEMLNSVFAQDYRDEKLYEYIDLINVMYVAFTRAKDELIVFAKMPNLDDKKKKISNMGDVLYYCFEDKIGLDGGCDIGDWSQSVHKEEVNTAISIKQAVSIDIDNRLRLSMSSPDFFSEENIRSKGIIYHDILSKISVVEDVDRAVEEAIVEGRILASQRDEIRDYIAKRIESVEDRHWFDNTYKHYNELSIISPNGDEFRPDRVMVSGDKAIIVDYKIGDKKLDSYIKQVGNYKNQVKEAGYSDVYGYVWYLATCEVEEV